MKERKRAWIFVPLAAVCLAFALPRVRLLAGADVSRACTLLVDMELNEPKNKNWKDLETARIQICLYQVADMEESGQYHIKERFKGLGLDGINKGIADWRAVAQAAADSLGEQDKPEFSLEFTGQKGKIEHIPAGMYLLQPEAALTAENEYVFLPYLVSLPNNTYQITGNDSWEYEVKVGLKPEKRVRYGDLLVKKRLETYNKQMGTAVFVFQVEAVKDLDGDGEEEKVYSDVLTLCFDGPGEKAVRAEHIPAGAKATVTEVYSGASYTLTTAPEQTAVILAEGEEDAPAAAEFTNRYNGGLIPSAGVSNHFVCQKETGEWELAEVSYSGQAKGKGQKDEEKEVVPQ